MDFHNDAGNQAVYGSSGAIRPYFNNTDNNYPIHWDEAYEVIMPIENGYTVVVEGRRVDLRPRDILIISPGSLHSIEAPPTGVRYIIMFDADIYFNISGLEKMNAFISGYALYTPENTPVLSEMNAFIEKIYNESALNDPLKYASIYAAVLELMIMAKRNDTGRLANQSVRPEQKYNQYLNSFLQVCRYIEDNCCDNITAEKLANLSGFSKSHFIRLFKQFTNTTYYSYLNYCRLNRAKHLLALSPDMSITEVSMQSGFSSIATFNRLFKQQEHCSPREYRTMRISC